MIGKTFNDFTIKKHINAGNMGEIYLATQNSLEREVALKIVRTVTDDPKINRFMKEAKLAASIQHPNIISIYSVGQEKDFAYIAMEYIPQKSLEVYLKEHGSLTEDIAFKIALRICDGLQAALKLGIIHRDIKPDNILLKAIDNPTLVDFGLSKRAQDETQLTQQGLILGTPRYISPEQASGEKVDFRSDIYSFGATIYHILTGRPLFSGRSIVEVICKHKYEHPNDPRLIKPYLKRETSLIIAKMLQKDQAKRYESYVNLQEDIQNFLAGIPLKYASELDASVYKFDPDLQEKDKHSTSKKLFKSLKSLLFPKESSKPLKVEPKSNQTFEASLLSNDKVFRKIKEDKKLKKMEEELDNINETTYQPLPEHEDSKESTENEKALKSINETTYQPLPEHENSKLQEETEKMEKGHIPTYSKSQTEEDSNDTDIKEDKDTQRITFYPEVDDSLTPVSDSHEMIELVKSSCRNTFNKISLAFGHYLIERNVLTEAQLQEATEIQAIVNRKFGQIAIDEGLLLPEQVTQILKVRKKIKKHFGQIAVQMGFLDTVQVSYLLKQQDKYFVSIIEILLRERMVSKELLEYEQQYFEQSYSTSESDNHFPPQISPN